LGLHDRGGDVSEVAGWWLGKPLVSAPRMLTR
jgi:hypothetical protein